jgi:hypothetical protein
MAAGPRPIRPRKSHSESIASGKACPGASRRHQVRPWFAPDLRYQPTVGSGFEDPLEKKKYQKNDNDAGRREWRHQRRQHCHQGLRCRRVGADALCTSTGMGVLPFAPPGSEDFVAGASFWSFAFNSRLRSFSRFEPFVSSPARPAASRRLRIFSLKVVS